MLIGYSFGAGVLPFAYNRLPADDARTRRAGVAARRRAPRGVRVQGHRLVRRRAGRRRAGRSCPRSQRFPPGLLQCVYGDEEEDTLCRDPALAGAEIIRTSGGHHFDGDYRALAQHILDALARRVGREPRRDPTHDQDGETDHGRDS